MTVLEERRFDPPTVATTAASAIDDAAPTGEVTAPDLLRIAIEIGSAAEGGIGEADAAEGGDRGPTVLAGALDDADDAAASIDMRLRIGMLIRGCTGEADDAAACDTNTRLAEGAESAGVAAALPAPDPAAAAPLICGSDSRGDSTMGPFPPPRPGVGAKPRRLTFIISVD